MKKIIICLYLTILFFAKNSVSSEYSDQEKIVKVITPDQEINWLNKASAKEIIVWWYEGKKEEFFKINPSSDEFNKLFENHFDNFKKECLNEHYQSVHCMQGLLSQYYFENQEYRKAIYWARKASDFGDLSAIVVLKRCYFNGLGVIKNIEEGLKWFIIQISLQGDAEGNNLVKKMLDSNPAIKKVIDNANTWLKEHEELIYRP